MAAAKTQTVHNGKLYYSITAAAKLLGITTPKLKKIIVPEGLDWIILRAGGPLWVSAESIAAYLHRRNSKTTQQ